MYYHIVIILHGELIEMTQLFFANYVGTIPTNPAVPKGGYEDYLFTFTAIGASPTLTVEAVGGNATALL